MSDVSSKSGKIVVLPFEREWNPRMGASHANTADPVVTDVTNVVRLRLPANARNKDGDSTAPLHPEPCQDIQNRIREQVPMLILTLLEEHSEVKEACEKYDISMMDMVLITSPPETGAIDHEERAEINIKIGQAVQVDQGLRKALKLSFRAQELNGEYIRLKIDQIADPESSHHEKMLLRAQRKLKSFCTKDLKISTEQVSALIATTDASILHFFNCFQAGANVYTQLIKKTRGLDWERE